MVLNVEGPREVVRDMETQKLKAGNTLNLSVDMDGCVCAPFQRPQ